MHSTCPAQYTKKDIIYTYRISVAEVSDPSGGVGERPTCISSNGSVMPENQHKGDEKPARHWRAWEMDAKSRRVVAFAQHRRASLLHRKELLQYARVQQPRSACLEML